MMTIMRDPMRDIYRGVEIENRSPFDFLKGSNPLIYQGDFLFPFDI